MKSACLTGLLLLALSTTSFANDLSWDSIGAELLDVRTVVIHPDNPDLIFAGTSKGLYISEDRAKIWRPVVSVNGQCHGVNYLNFDLKDNNILYAACGNGLYCSRNMGKDWKRIFRGKSALENNCLAVAVFAPVLYLGTEGGLFMSEDNGRTWHKGPGELGDNEILNIAFDAKEPDTIYLASVAGVFRGRRRGMSWEKIFTVHPTENGKDDEEASEDAYEEKRYSDIRYVCIDPNRLNYVYVATSQGVYQSPDRGQTWESLAGYGLLNQEVSYLRISSEFGIYACGKSGIFVYGDERWDELSFGITMGKVKSLASDRRGVLYAAGEKGLFRTEMRSSAFSGKDSVLKLISKGEPEIREVQQVAIQYAEVGPEKIQKWRSQAAKRALLPKLTVEMDRDKDKTIGSSIWGTCGTTTTPGKYYIGPEDETKYDNSNFSVSLSWDLGDLIWSDDQTSIDTRSRLMVQLRDDILDEVNKLYFERLRVKLELDNISIEEKRKRLEKELRLSELTASLDSLTGGYFSNKLASND
jgi:photosystem II stability/assembly factor-like uncharacterized protein